jgi:SH3-like domain-containing protein
MSASRRSRLFPDRSPPSLAALALALLAVLLAAVPAGAAEKDEDGLPLPRFASTRSAPINVRVGPGLKYDVAWIFNRSKTPIEIIAEFDIWREVRDFDGTEGWIQQNLLSGDRAGLVSPWKKDVTVPLLSGASANAAVRAYLPSGFRIDIRRCDGTWCQVQATGTDADDHPGSYSGYLQQAEIWGVYQGEKF